MNLGLQSYLRFDCGTGVGAMFGSSHSEPEEVRLEVWNATSLGQRSQHLRVTSSFLFLIVNFFVFY